MANDDKLVEIMAEMPIKQDLMVEELRGVKSEVSSVKSEIIKLNLQTAENTRALLTLADKVEHIADLQSRVSKLEKAVFK